MKNTAVMLEHGQATESFRKLRCSSNSWTCFLLFSTFCSEDKDHLTTRSAESCNLVSWFRCFLLRFVMKRRLHEIRKVIVLNSLHMTFNSTSQLVFSLISLLTQLLMISVLVFFCIAADKYFPQFSFPPIDFAYSSTFSTLK